MQTNTQEPKKRKAAQRIPKLVVCAYQPADEKYPVLCLQVSLPPNGKFGQYLSPVVRRADHGYMDLLKVCNNQPYWMYNQQPKPLM